MGIRVKYKHELPQIYHLIFMLECYRGRGRGRPRPRGEMFDLFYYSKALLCHCR